MSAVDVFAPRRGMTSASPAAALASLSLLALIAAGMALVLYRFPPSWWVVAALSVGLLGVLALAIARYETAVTVGFLLFGVVAVEPAPPDAVFIVVIAVAVVTGRFNLSRVPLVVLSLLGGFIFMNLLSSIEAIDPDTAARFMAITMYLAVFAVWFTSYLNSERRARAVVRAYIAPAAFFGLLASVALFVPLPGSEQILRYEGTRATGLFEDPNVFGPFLVPAALILLQEILDPRLLRASRGTKIATFLILTGGVLFSYSRAAWVNYAVAVLVLLCILAMRRGGGRKALGVLTILVVTAIGVVGTLTLTDSTDFLEQRARFQSYDTARFSAQRTGIELAEQYPAGIGPGQFELLSPISTHSTYVRTLAEQGLIGLCLLVALFLATLIFAGRNAVLGRDSYGVGSATLLAAWVGLLVNSLVVDTLHWRHLWFVAALIWVGTMRPMRESPAPR